VKTVFILPFGADTGGVNHQIVDAFRLEPEWLVRAMISGRNYIEYPSDLIFDYRMLGEWWRAADVIHLSHEFYRLRKVERLKLPARPKVMHYHGTGPLDWWQPWTCGCSIQTKLNGYPVPIT
jgi:hypothetical protein